MMGMQDVFRPKLILISWFLIVTLTGTFAAQENWGLTKFDVKKVLYRFVIKKYSQNGKAFGQAISSPLFFGDDSQEFKWQLHLYPKGYKSTEKTGTALYLTLVKTPIPITANVKCSIINKAGVQVNPQTFKHTYTGSNKIYGWSTFVGQYWLDTYWKYYWLPNDELTLQVEIDFSKNIIRVSNKCSTINTEKCTSLPYSNSFLNDINLQVDDEMIKAHKAPLIAHSSWFKDEIEFYPYSYIITLPYGIKSTAMKEAIRFIYEGETDKSQNTLEELLELSDELGMSKLKLYVEEQMCKMMTERNVEGFLKLARSKNANNLKREAQNFIIGLDEKVTK